MFDKRSAAAFFGEASVLSNHVLVKTYLLSISILTDGYMHVLERQYTKMIITYMFNLIWRRNYTTDAI